MSVMQWGSGWSWLPDTLAQTQPKSNSGCFITQAQPWHNLTKPIFGRARFVWVQPAQVEPLACTKMRRV